MSLVDLQIINSHSQRSYIITRILLACRLLNTKKNKIIESLLYILDA